MTGLRPPAQTVDETTVGRRGPATGAGDDRLGLAAGGPLVAGGVGTGLGGVDAAGSARTVRSVAVIWSAEVPNGNAPRSRPPASTMNTSAVWLIE